MFIKKKKKGFQSFDVLIVGQIINRRMGSSVVYSKVMHSVFITGYALLVIQILCTNEFTLDLLNSVIGPINFVYLFLSLAEVGLRWFEFDDPLIVAKSGHVAHFSGTVLLYAYMDPLNPLEGLVFLVVRISLYFWTIYVLFADGVLPMLADDYFTH